MKWTPLVMNKPLGLLRTPYLVETNLEKLQICFFLEVLEKEALFF
jgi:hypothetical protein